MSSRYRTRVVLDCGRCLGPTEVDVVGRSDDEFTPKVDVNTGHPLAEQPDSPELAIDERHVLDLTEVIRQDVLTRLPLQPLCRPDCPGLCPDCGRDLRAESCSCARSSEASSPFASLADLLRPEGPRPTAAD